MRRVALVVSVCAMSVAPALGSLVEDFDGGLGAWSSIDLLGGTSVAFWDVNTTFVQTNHTGGSGLAAMIDSDWAGDGDYDVALVSPSFSVPAGGTLEYDTNYQNLGGVDAAWVDISTDGGVSWTNLLLWEGDHGTFGGPPGEHVSLDLSVHAGSTAQVRYRYDSRGGGGWDWWWQVDNVVVTPEPSTLALWGIGAVALLRRR